MRSNPNLFRNATLAGLCLAALAVGNSLSAQEIQWRSDYTAALVEAREKKLPLVIDFYTSTCVYCQKLDMGTFRDPAIVRMLNERFIPLKVEAHSHPWLTSALGIHRYPSLVFAAWDTTHLSTHEGYLDASNLLLRLQRSMAASTLRVVDEK